MAFHYIARHLRRTKSCTRLNASIALMERSNGIHSTCYQQHQHHKHLYKNNRSTSNHSGNSSSSSPPNNKELPYHQIHPMPSLSRSYNNFTEYGIISKWNIQEGQPIRVGESICEIQTDQGMFELDALDNGYMARHLVQATTLPTTTAATTISADDDDGATYQKIKVGVPIFVTVEEMEDVEMFRDYVVVPLSEPSS
eukprot:scaffold57386_cov66-Cyclotella_meneghiniana.AAC.11